jgi:hypothetical protein
MPLPVVKNTLQFGYSNFHLVHNFLRVKVNLKLLETGLFVTGVAAAVAYIPAFAGIVAAVPTFSAISVLLVFLMLFSLLLLLGYLLLLGSLLLIGPC